MFGALAIINSKSRRVQNSQKERTSHTHPHQGDLTLSQELTNQHSSNEKNLFGTSKVATLSQYALPLRKLFNFAPFEQKVVAYSEQLEDDYATWPYWETQIV